MKVLHILYSGLGGHANVVFSFIQADENRRYNYEALFAGNEEIRKTRVVPVTAGQTRWNTHAR